MSGRERGRGAYYRERYGGRGRGSSLRRGGRAGHVSDQRPAGAFVTAASGARDWNRLASDLAALDGKQYGAYNELRGQYEHSELPTFTLSVDHVQGDPYASPSKVRVIVPWNQTGLPRDYLQTGSRRVALCDFLTRTCANVIRVKHMDQNVQGGGGWSAPKGGAFNINAPGQEILPRTSAIITADEEVELRFATVLPAAGRKILGATAHKILVVDLVDLVRRSALHGNLDQAKLRDHVISAEKQSALRAQLQHAGLIAFVANGSILPRASGASQAPMDRTTAVPIQAPPELEVEMPLPDGTTVRGMGIPRGITLLTGGGFHGKSTLLQALEMGIYNHIPGDGREQIVTDPTAVKIRAEDGRCVSATDISPYISNLPGGKQTTAFSTDDASGSTSMAANIQEALEAGCGTLFIDEDSSATNLLVRDTRMRLLIQQEPITPLVAKSRALYEQHGVSTVIVVGGLGDWLEVADHVIAMERYVPRCITPAAKQVVSQYPAQVVQSPEYGTIPHRSIQVKLAGIRTPYAPRKHFIALKPEARDIIDDPAQSEPGIDVSGLDQITEVGQSRLIAALLKDAERQPPNQTIADLLTHLNYALDVENPMEIVPRLDGDLVAVRRFELAAALSRMRTGLIVKAT